MRYCRCYFVVSFFSCLSFSLALAKTINLKFLGRADCRINSAVAGSIRRPLAYDLACDSGSRVITKSIYTLDFRLALQS
jgi:hypothetical protein